MLELYGEGLVRILDAIDDAGEAAAGIRARLVDDGVVASLLLIHDLYPVDLETRVARRSPRAARTSNRTAATSSCSGVADGVARISLVGHCKTARRRPPRSSWRSSRPSTRPRPTCSASRSRASRHLRPRAPTLGRTLPL